MYRISEEEKMFMCRRWSILGQISNPCLTSKKGMICMDKTPIVTVHFSLSATINADRMTPDQLREELTVGEQEMRTAKRKR